MGDPLPEHRVPADRVHRFPYGVIWSLRGIVADQSLHGFVAERCEADVLRLLGDALDPAGQVAA